MLAAERGAGENTLAAYRRDLDDFSANTSVTKRRTDRRAPATDDVRGYLQSLWQARLCRGLGRAAALGDPPALSLPLCRRTARRRSGRHHRRTEARPRAAEGARASRRSTACSPPPRTAIGKGRTNGERLRAARLNCLLEVLYATGLRVSELVSLPASAAERNARMLVVRGKGGKERLVPLNDAAKTAMAEYRALRRSVSRHPLVPRKRGPRAANSEQAARSACAGMSGA